MRSYERWLLAGGVVTGFAALLHVAIIIGGADWYRFFGAGEGMARLAARGSPYPTVITSTIAAILGVWTLYALSGARVIARLPFLRFTLGLISTIYILRGALGLPVVFLVDGPYMRELRARPGFMIVSSAVCGGLGLCYALGAARLSKDR